MADRPWRLIGGDLDRQTGRRFPPVAGGGRGYRFDIPAEQMSAVERGRSVPFTIRVPFSITRYADGR